MNKFFAYAQDMNLVVHKTGGQHSTLIVTKEDMNAEVFILGCHTMDPGGGGGAPIHTHEKETKAMFFYEGTGIPTIEGKEYEITPDSVCT